MKSPQNFLLPFKWGEQIFTRSSVSWITQRQQAESLSNLALRLTTGIGLGAITSECGLENAEAEDKWIEMKSFPLERT
jgi:hypothetical protein